MKLLLAGIVLIFMAGSEADRYNFPVQAAQGAGDMWRAYQDLKKPNGLTVINISMPEETVTLRREDQEAAEVISDLREMTNGPVRVRVLKTKLPIRRPIAGDEAEEIQTATGQTDFQRNTDKSKNCC